MATLQLPIIEDPSFAPDSFQHAVMPDPLQRPITRAGAAMVSSHPGATTVLLLLAPLLGAASVGRRRLRSRRMPNDAARRVHTRADGRCLLRAVVHQLPASVAKLPPSIGSVLHDNHVECREYLSSVRRAASARVREACESDENLAAVVNATFPDERFESFDAWAETMETHDDTNDAVSCLWQGGGSWLVYGLGLLYECTISVTPLFPLPLGAGSGFSRGTTSEVVNGGSRRVGLAMLMNDDGEPDHFDVWAETETPSADAARS